MSTYDQRIEELARAAEALIAGPPEFLRAFTGEEAGARQQRRAIIIASLRDQEYQGRVGIAVEDLAADLEAVLRERGLPAPEDPRAEVVEVLRQLEGWQAVDGGLAPDRAERDGLRRRVERDYALARSLRVFLPHWDEVQRALRRRYISLSANYFAQAVAALDTLLEELNYEDTDPLRCHTAWQSLGQALHGINTETRDFARELRALRVDANHPQVLADIADRLGILHEKFFRVAAEGSARVRERLELLRDERHDGENVRRLRDALRAREEEWSVGLGETAEERRDRLDTVARAVPRELDNFDRFMAESGPGSWREGARVISLALVDLTERIHAAISLRLQQTQAVAALLRRARDLAEGGEGATLNARRYLWDASGAIHAALWVQAPPSSDAQVRLDRWLEQRGGSPLPLVDEEIWQKSLRPRLRPVPPSSPPVLETADDWNPGEDPRMRELEEARARLVERLIAAGSAARLAALESVSELRLLASFLWLPRDSAPLRRLGLRIQSPGAGMPRRAVIRGPGFEVELENYRFSATSAAHQATVAARRSATESAAHLSAIAAGERAPRPPSPRVASALVPGPQPVAPSDPLVTKPLPVVPPGARPTHPLPAAEVRPTKPLTEPTGPLGPGNVEVRPARPRAPEPAPVTGGRRFWPFAGRRGPSDQG
ncbi:MAG: hypothetical protein IVW57_04785 [Ktedonobacterales bacterium]|nr:hypothetical protein [Ktedonobacterales bacterium]